MNGSLRSALSGARRKTKVVEVPDVGPVTLQEMSGSERDDLEASTIVEEDGKRTVNSKHFRARLLVLCIVDDSGKRLYTESDVAEVSGFPIRVLDSLFAAAQELNSMGVTAVEDARKNSGSGATAASVSP
jgi:hypothetical protein